MCSRVAAIVLVWATVLAGALTLQVSAQQPPVARTPQQAALVDLTGNWVSVVTEEWLWRMTTPRKGDYTSIPLSDEGRRVADRWDPATEGSCQAYGAGGLMRIPMRLRISWRGDDALAVETDAGQQTRLLRFDRTPPAGARSLQGHSMAEWEPIGGPPVVRSGRPGPAGAPRGGALKVVTTNLSEGWLRPNGVAYSESTSLLEYLGPRDLPQRRHLADRHLRRQRSALPREGLHDERALQAGSGRLEVETRALSHVIQNAEFRMQTLTHRTLVATIVAILAAASLTAPSLAQGPGPAQPAMVELAGSWTMSNEEELLIRVDPGPELGNFTGFPLNAAGRQKALSWNSTIQAVPEHQARPHPAQYSMRGPGPDFHMSEVIDPVSRRLIAYTITGLFENANRTIWLDGRPHPSEFAEHLWNGFSTGVWENGMLKVTTTHMKQAFLQRNGIPSSPYAVMTEYFIRHGNLLMMISQVDDPIYLEEPMIRSSTWRWNPGQREQPIGQVEIAEELPDIKLGDVPHYPLGTRHPEYADANGLPFEATLGGKETLYPEYVERLKQMMRETEKRGSR